jgi:hypothetical protein
VKLIWALTYAFTQSSAIENNTLSYYKVTNDFWYKVNHLSGFAVRGNIAKRSFSIAFREESPKSWDKSNSEKKGKGKGKGQQHRKDKSNTDSNPKNNKK